MGAAVLEEWNRAQKDPRLRDAMKALLGVYLREDLGDWSSDSERQEALNRAKEVLETESITVVAGDGQANTLLSELMKVDRMYPGLGIMVPAEARETITIGGKMPLPMMRLTCPHCGHQARASSAAKYGCPSCRKNFKHDARTHMTTKAMKLPFAVHAVFWIGLIAIFASC